MNHAPRAWGDEFLRGGSALLLARPHGAGPHSHQNAQASWDQASITFCSEPAPRRLATGGGPYGPSRGPAPHRGRTAGSGPAREPSRSRPRRRSALRAWPRPIVPPRVDSPSPIGSLASARADPYAGEPRCSRAGRRDSRGICPARSTPKACSARSLSTPGGTPSAWTGQPGRGGHNAPCSASDGNESGARERLAGREVRARSCSRRREQRGLSRTQARPAN